MLCLEVDLSKPLLSKFTLEDEVLPIEYEGIHMVCFNCGIYGHKQGQCGLEGTETVSDENPADGVHPQGTEQAMHDNQPRPMNGTTAAPFFSSLPLLHATATVAAITPRRCCLHHSVVDPTTRSRSNATRNTKVISSISKASNTTSENKQPPLQSCLRELGG
nr:uncharacterized protein LOC109147335 [Ipomoea batatas]